MAFAREVLDLVENMKKSCRGQPQLPSRVPPALETFQTTEWNDDPDLWSFADLPQLFNYLRGAAALRIPPEWKAVVPKSLDTLK